MADKTVVKVVGIMSDEQALAEEYVKLVLRKLEDEYDGFLRIAEARFDLHLNPFTSYKLKLRYRKLEFTVSGESDYGLANHVHTTTFFDEGDYFCFQMAKQISSTVAAKVLSQIKSQIGADVYYLLIACLGHQVEDPVPDTKPF